MNHTYNTPDMTSNKWNDCFLSAICLHVFLYFIFLFRFLLLLYCYSRVLIGSFDHSWLHNKKKVERLYSMCEQALVNYYCHRNKQHTNSSTMPYLSPMTLLVVTLWYFKHYHSERYISAKVNLV